MSATQADSWTSSFASGCALAEITQPRAKLPSFLSVGTILDGSYLIDSYLAMGGMCEIYTAHHLKLRKTIAIKMLRPVFAAEPLCVERFEREAIAMARLNHPNIAQVYGFGSFESRFQTRQYMSLEFVEGSALSELLKQQDTKTLSRELALPIFLKLCDALVHAHGQGIIHRDLKPGNIMIGSDGQTVKVIDFGIAKVLAADEGALQKLTNDGGAVGSLMYMSPEQCIGSTIDQRTDIYSLGCLMYEVLTGSPPLCGPTPYITMHKHVFEQPQMIPAIDDELGRVIMRALAKHPAARPQSALELKSELIRATLIAPDLRRVRQARRAAPANHPLGSSTPAQLLAHLRSAIG